MADKKAKEISQEQVKDIQFFRDILNRNKRTSQELLLDCATVNSKYYNIEPILCVKKRKNNNEIREINGRTKNKKSSSQLIQIIK